MLYGAPLKCVLGKLKVMIFFQCNLTPLLLRKVLLYWETFPLHLLAIYVYFYSRMYLYLFGLFIFIYFIMIFALHMHAPFDLHLSFPYTIHHFVLFLSITHYLLSYPVELCLDA